MKTETKSLYFKMRMSSETRKMLETLAKLEGRSGGNMITKLITDKYREHEDLQNEIRRMTRLDGSNQ